MTDKEIFGRAYQLYKEQNYEEALKMLAPLAEAGYAPAQHQIGVCYAGGSGVEQSFEYAVVCFYQAAKQGYDEAQFSLGICFANGLGVPQDWDTASQFLWEAADQDHPQALYKLGFFYQCGDIVDKIDCEGLSEAETKAAMFRKAVKLYQKSAELGSKKAQEKLKSLKQEGKI